MGRDIVGRGSGAGAGGGAGAGVGVGAGAGRMEVKRNHGRTGGGLAMVLKICEEKLKMKYEGDTKIWERLCFIYRTVFTS